VFDKTNFIEIRKHSGMVNTKFMILHCVKQGEWIWTLRGQLQCSGKLQFLQNMWLSHSVRLQTYSNSRTDLHKTDTGEMSSRDLRFLH